MAALLQPPFNWPLTSEMPIGMAQAVRAGEPSWEKSLLALQVRT